MIWFADAPPVQHRMAGGGGLECSSTDGEIGWVIARTRLRDRQLSDDYEFTWFPRGLLAQMTERLEDLGVQLPGSWAEISIDRVQGEAFIRGASAKFCTVGTQQVFGCGWQFDGYQMFVTLWGEEWLATLSPIRSQLKLFIADGAD